VKFGVIGNGSIGKRHIRNLITLGFEDIILLRKIGKGNEYNCAEFNEMKAFLDDQPDAIIIANPTSLHAEYLTQILDRNMHVMVEKPVLATMEELQTIQKQLINYTAIGMTAYNMRFHPCVKETQRLIESGVLGKVYSSRFFVGQYLPDWRPNNDYSKSYSADKEMGGGVIFDLIHEIDLACFLVGEPRSNIAAEVDKLSDLQIQTEDIVEALYRSKRNCIVSIHLDYICQEYQRYIEIIGERCSLRADLYTNQIAVTSSVVDLDTKFFREFSRNDMYLEMLSSFVTCIEEKRTTPISLQEGLLSNKIAIDIRNKFYHGNA
jgi:predicted dehydrogenase